MNKLLKKLLVLGLASTVALASVGGIGCKDDGPVDNGGSTTPNTSVVEKPDPEISMASSLSLLLGDSVNAGVTTKNIKGDVVYSVNNEGRNVVTFEGGTVKAIGVGSAIITASFGNVSASCPVTVSYGDYLPSLEIASNITEGVYLALGSTNSIAPYISYNGIAYDDGEFTFSSDNEEVVSVSNNGVITAHQATDEPVNVSVSANWRDFSSNDYVTLTKNFQVQVRNNVSFFVNGEIPVDLSVNTPATFQTPAEHNNVIKIVPTAVVNGEEIALSGSNVKVEALGDTQKGRDFLWDSAKNNFAAFKKGKALVELSYRLGDDLFTTSFEVEITRPTKQLTETVELFSARSGLFKLDNGDGTYTDTALEAVAWGRDVTLVDAYSDGVALTVNNSNGAITGLNVNQDTETNATIILGTATDLIEVPVKAAAYYISTAQDFKDAFEQVGLYELITGYHKLLNDLDMTGVILDNRIDSDDDFGARRYAGYRVDGAYIDSTSKKKIGFNGVFDGDGHTITNATSTMLTYDGKVYEKDPTDPANDGNNPTITVSGRNRGYGLFHNVLGDGVIKNVAFDNLLGQKVEGNQNLLYGLTAPLAYGFSGTLQNVFINVGEDNATTRGVVGSIGAAASLKNVVVEFERPESFDFASQVDTFCSNDLYAYGFGSLANNLNASASYQGVYVISRVPIAFDTAKGFSSSDTSNKNAITYAENETELIYNFTAFDVVHGAVKHTVKSTVGDHTEVDGKVLVTGKTKVFNGVQRYNNYFELANCDFQKTAERSALFAASSYWAMAGNVPIWHSMLDKHSENFTASIDGGNELTIDLYEELPIDVTLYGAPANKVVFTENSDLIEITANNTIKGVKIGTGAEVSAVFTYGGQERSINFTVDVLYPFYLTNNGDAIENALVRQPETEQFTIEVFASGNLVENVKFTSNSDALTINGNIFKGVRYQDGITVTAEFTYMGDSYVETFYVDILDMLAENATVKVNGTAIEGEEISLVIDADPATISVNSNGTDIPVTLTSSNDNFVVEEDKLQANLYGQSELALTFINGGQIHVKKVIANAVHSDTPTIIDSIVDFDAFDGKLLSSEIDDSGIVSINATFGKEIAMLNRENGGITEDGAIRAKLSNGDTVPGVPVINNTLVTFDDAKVEMVVATYKKVYTFTAKYYTSIIEDLAELKEALDINYTVNVYNNGFYKLANDLTVDSASPLTFSYVGASSNIKNINSNCGFVGVFDGAGHSIDFNGTNVGTYGLFANFNHDGGYNLKTPITVKNLAVLDYKTTSKLSIFAKYVKDHRYSGDVYFNNIYASYSADAVPNGIVFESGQQCHYTNVVIDSTQVTAVPTLTDDSFGDAAGMISPLTGFTGGSLFATLRRGGSTMVNNTSAIVVGSHPLVKNINITLDASMFTHTNDNGTYTHTLRGTGYTFDQGTAPLLTGSAIQEPYYGVAGNKQDIAVIRGLRPEVAALAAKNSGNTFKVKYCATCFGTFKTGMGSKCGVEGCGASLATMTNAWTNPLAYDWILDVKSYVNPGNTNLNGVIVFKNVTKYDTYEEMISANNTFDSFVGETGEGLWKVDGGKLVWVGAQA